MKKKLRKIYDRLPFGKSVLRKLKHVFIKSKALTYNEWFNKIYLPTELNTSLGNIVEFDLCPLISIIVPTYNTPVKYLVELVDSIVAQSYQNWELCFADGASSNLKMLARLKKYAELNSKIKVVFLAENLHISGNSNAALKLASGDYIALMDHDDTLTPNALFEVVKAINLTGAEFIYSDEDKQEMNGTYCEPHYKPDYSPELLHSQNYMSHLGVIKKSLIDAVGGFEIGLEGSQDYDLYLKVAEKTTKIYHIQKVLYHWRKVPGSTAAVFSDKSYAQEAGRKALENALYRRGISGEVFDGKYPGTYRVKYKIHGNPLVSIIIPFKDKPELLKMCLDSILDKTTYDNFEIIGVSNNSEDPRTFTLMSEYQNKYKRIKFIEHNVAFNYSEINNYAVNHYASGEHIVLLNNDIEVITPDWIESLLEFSQRDNVGAVGARLYYPNNTVQHAGVIIGPIGLASHVNRNLTRGEPGYFGRFSSIQNLSAVTAACLMVKRSVYDLVSGLNENELKIAFNDVDFCLRLREHGLLNVYTPYCEAYHHESVSRGVEDSPEKIARFNSEVNYMLARHTKILKDGDPYYNPNLSLEREDFSLKIISRLIEGI